MFTHTRIALICSAPLDISPQIKERICQFPILIAVDGGANHCHQLGLRPDLIVGDFDSVNPDYLQHFSQVPQKHYPRDKDATDLEIVLGMAFQAPLEEVVVFGGLHGRTDHTIGNLILLSRYPGKVFLESEHERLFVIDKNAKLDVRVGQQISLIPLNGPATGIRSKGLKWELQERDLDKQFIGISNEAIDTQVEITVTSGDLLCCINF